jgi:hypothetical protein
LDKTNGSRASQGGHSTSQRGCTAFVLARTAARRPDGRWAAHGNGETHADNLREMVRERCWTLRVRSHCETIWAWSVVDFHAQLVQDRRVQMLDVIRIGRGPLPNSSVAPMLTLPRMPPPTW